MGERPGTGPSRSGTRYRVFQTFRGLCSGTYWHPGGGRGRGERKQNMVCMCPKTQTKNLLIIDIIMSNCNKGLFIIIQKDEIG